MSERKCNSYNSYKFQNPATSTNINYIYKIISGTNLLYRH